MPETILDCSHYSVEDAARLLEIPLEQAHELFRRAIASGSVEVAYYGGDTPRIQGHDLKRLAGLLSPSTSRHRSTLRAVGARRTMVRGPRYDEIARKKP